MGTSTVTSPPAFVIGTRVRLHGLETAAQLNGAIGFVSGDPDGERLPVLLAGPAAAARPAGIKARPTNLEPLPPQLGVQVEGGDVQPMPLTAQQVRACCSGGSSGGLPWRLCKVPGMLGVPLALLQLAPTSFSTRLKWERYCVLLLSLCWRVRVCVCLPRPS